KLDLSQLLLHGVRTMKTNLFDHIAIAATMVYQKADLWHPAFIPSGVMNSDVSEATETDEDVRILNVPDDVQEHAADTLWLDTREWFESLHPEIDRFFVKIEATRRSGSCLNEPKGWKRILWLAMAAVAMGGGLSLCAKSCARSNKAKGDIRLAGGGRLAALMLSAGPEPLGPMSALGQKRTFRRV